MNTPITDASSVHAGECYHTAEVLHSDLARRLETDRAALMVAANDNPKADPGIGGQ
jgi:hypothetical protein